MKWGQYVRLEASGYYYDGPPIEIPIPPFPGLVIGALTVKKVLVCQDDDDQPDERKNVIEYEDIDEEHATMLVETHGWVERHWEEDKLGATP